jgi:hypothetical protein
MKRLVCGALLLLLFGTLAAGQREKKRIMPTLIVNAQYVYVTTYEGSEPLPQVSVENLRAIGIVENAIKSWGRYRVTQRPANADIIILVNEGRPYASSGGGSFEDELAIYDARDGLNSSPLWRGLMVDGLEGNAPLIKQFRDEVEEAARQLPQPKGT